MRRLLNMAMFLTLAPVAGCESNSQIDAPVAPAATSNSQDSQAGGPAQSDHSGQSQDEQTADAPVIVAGAYLTCTPLVNETAGATEAESDVGCRVDGAPTSSTAKPIQWNMMIIGELPTDLSAQLYSHPTSDRNVDGIYVFHSTASNKTALGLLGSSPVGFEAVSSDGSMRVVGVNPGETQPSAASRALMAGFERDGSVSVAPNLADDAPVAAPLDPTISLDSTSADPSDASTDDNSTDAN